MWLTGKNNVTPLRKLPSDAGFTLLELLVVLGIMGLIYGLAIPIYARLMPSVTLNATAEEVRSDLRQARLHAILSGKTVAFILRDNGESYTRSDITKNKRTKGIKLSFQEKNKQQVFFTPDGKNGGFTLFLTAGDKENQREKKISSDWITGRISMSSQ